MGGRGYLEQKYRWCKEQTNLSAAVPLEQYHDRYTQKRCCTRGFLSRKAAMEKGQIEHSNRDTALKNGCTAMLSPHHSICTFALRRRYVSRAATLQACEITICRYKLDIWHNWLSYFDCDFRYCQ